MIAVERKDGSSMAYVNRRIDVSRSRSSFDRLYRRNLAMANFESKAGSRGSDWDDDERVSWR
jgi:hypothetical protein